MFVGLITRGIDPNNGYGSVPPLMVSVSINRVGWERWGWERSSEREGWFKLIVLCILLDIIIAMTTLI